MRRALLQSSPPSNSYSFSISLSRLSLQDHDGSHIKGLIINLFDHFYPSLLKLPNFLVEFITPIVKVTKGKQELSFFTLPEYETWKEMNNDGKGWVIKYFKGLGTSTSQDAKKYFRAMNKHMLPFETTQPGDRELIDLAFNKKKADDRKEWLRDFVVSDFDSIVFDFREWILRFHFLDSFSCRTDLFLSLLVLFSTTPFSLEPTSTTISRKFHTRTSSIVN